MRNPAARAVPIVVALGAGLVLGLAGPVAGKFDNTLCEALSVVFSGGWPWACYAFVVGLLRRSRIESALLAATGLAVGVMAYYGFKDLYPAVPVGLEAGTAGDGVSSRVFVWGTAAFIFGAPVGLAGNFARTPGVGGLLLRLLIPLIAYIETSQRLHTEADARDAIVGITWATIRVAACLAGAFFVGQAARNWWRGRQPT
ncbi:DUF6518 family protein [Streptomyces sp. NBC_00525]|uniref:DUF6518 family protein n=1 Tax=Streptomyces sp. NBC_00525 TaxID=2903660 RepID=UPI002E8046EC|nr:DUF6518 family protein [Streptomyces sp. NBC_00525]WUC95083.1 DUF6518 family protein [Streptomyces sp. NBC_00525]